MFNLFNNKSVNPHEQLVEKEKFYHVSEGLKDNKLAYAFFLDRKSHLSMDKNQIDSLSKYTWFAGSLTAERFFNHLKEFLTSPQSERLNPELKQKIQEYALALEKSETQGYLIDLARSSDLRLIFLILTGQHIGGSVEPTIEQINKLTEETLNQIHSLKEGEKRLFLVGSLLHENRISVEKLKEGWEVCYFDPNQTKYKRFHCTDTSAIFQRAFWEKVYKLKLSSHDKESAIGELAELVQKVGSEQDISPDACTRPQCSNSCHFKGLLAALKKEIVVSSTSSPEETLKYWTEFKCAFGEYFLQNAALDPEVKTHSLEKQELRCERVEKLALFSNIVREGRFDETVQSYLKAIKSLDPLYDLSELDKEQKEKGSPLKALKFLDGVLASCLEKYYLIPPEEMEVAKVENPCVKKTFEIHKKTMNSHQQKLEKQLDDELKMAGSPITLVLETVKTEWIRLTNQEDGYTLWRAPLAKEKIEGFLSRAIAEPNLMRHLSHRPAFVQALLQAIQMGKLESVKTIYESLNDQDKKALMYEIHQFSSDNEYAFISLSSLSNIREFYEAHPNDPFAKEFITVLSQKAIAESSLVDILKFFDETPMINLLNKFKLMNPSREQIEAFYKELNQNEKYNKLDEGNVSWALVLLWQNLEKYIIQSGWFDLLEKAPPAFLQIVHTPFKMSKENLLAFDKYLETLNNGSQHSSTMRRAYQEVIALNKYSYALLDEMPSLLPEKLYDALIPKELRVKYTESNFDKGLKVLSQIDFEQFVNLDFKARLFNLTLEDLLLSAARQSSKEWMSQIVTLCLQQKPEFAAWFTDVVTNLAEKFSKETPGPKANEMKSVFMLLLEAISEQDKINVKDKLIDSVLTPCLNSLDETSFDKLQKIMIKMEKQNRPFNHNPEIVGFHCRLVEKFPNTYLSNFLGWAHLQQQANILIEMEKSNPLYVISFISYWNAMIKAGVFRTEDKEQVLHKIIPNNDDYPKDKIDNTFRFIE